MEKLVFSTIMMKNDLQKMSYENNGIAAISKPVIFPINAVLGATLKKADIVTVVLLLKDDINKNAKRNMGEFMAELDSINEDIGAKITYEYIDSPFKETKETHEHLLSQMIEKIQERQEIYSDITYGPKPLPIVMFSVLNFAQRFLHAEIKHIIYGKVDFVDGKPCNPELFDVAPLYYLNSITNTMECNDPTRAKEILNTILEI